MTTTTTTVERVTLFNGQPEEWPAFSLRLDAAISKLRLSKIADKTEPRPADSSGDATARASRQKEQAAWDERNAQLHTLIVDRLEDTILLRVAAGVTRGDGASLFSSLEDKFNSADEAHMCKILRTLVRMEPETAEAVPAYTAEAVRLGTLLQQAGLGLNDRLLRMLIISALPEDMDSVRTHLLYTRKPSGAPLDLQDTQKVLQTDSITRAGNGTTPEGVLSEGRATVAKGKQTWGTRRNSQERQTDDNSRDVGAEKRHTHAKCKQRGCTNIPNQGFRFCQRCYEAYKAKQDSGNSRKCSYDDDDNRIKGFTLLLSEDKNNVEDSPQLQILDSGTSRICIPDKDSFHIMNTPDIAQLAQADGTYIPVKGMGDVQLEFPNKVKVMANNALYVPGIPRMLISQHHLIELGCEFHHTKQPYLVLPNQDKVYADTTEAIPKIAVKVDKATQNVDIDISDVIEQYLADKITIDQACNSVGVDFQDRSTNFRNSEMADSELDCKPMADAAPVLDADLKTEPDLLHADRSGRPADDTIDVGRATFVVDALAQGPKPDCPTNVHYAQSKGGRKDDDEDIFQLPRPRRHQRRKQSIRKDKFREDRSVNTHQQHNFFAVLTPEEENKPPDITNMQDFPLLNDQSKGGCEDNTDCVNG